MEFTSGEEEKSRGRCVDVLGGGKYTKNVSYLLVCRASVQSHN